MQTDTIVDNSKNSATKSLRILLVAENVSRKMSGESGLNFYYFELLQERGIDVWIVCHGRVKEELRPELSETEFKKVTFLEDTKLHIV